MPSRNKSKQQNVDILVSCGVEKEPEQLFQVVAFFGQNPI